MNHREVIDIQAVCSMLNVSSRTLRFYEEKGLINSIKSQSNRRTYDENQINRIKRILVLRTLGLSIKNILEIQKGDNDLKQALEFHKAKIISKINSMVNEIKILNEALKTISDKGDIFKECFDISNEITCTNEFIINLTNSFIIGDYVNLYDSFSDKLRGTTSLDDLTSIINETIHPLGKFVGIDKIISSEVDYIYYSYLRYENLGLTIKFVINKTIIQGFWLNYYEI